MQLPIKMLKEINTRLFPSTFFRLLILIIKVKHPSSSPLILPKLLLPISAPPLHYFSYHAGLNTHLLILGGILSTAGWAPFPKHDLLFPASPVPLKICSWLSGWRTAMRRGRNHTHHPCRSRNIFCSDKCRGRGGGQGQKTPPAEIVFEGCKQQALFHC